MDDHFVYAYAGGQLAVVERATGASSITILTPGFPGGGTMHVAPILGSQGALVTRQSDLLLSVDRAARPIGEQVGPGSRGNPRFVRGVIYVLNGGELHARREVDGALLWQWRPATGSLTGASVVTVHHIFVATSSTTHTVDPRTQ